MPRYDEFDEPGNRLLNRMRERIGNREPLAARRPGVAYGIAGSLVVLLVAVVWASYPHGRGQSGEALPVIHAEAGPVKTAPEAEGGMDIPNRESTVFNAVRGRNADGHVENLLPGSEQPIDRDQVFGTAKVMQATDKAAANAAPDAKSNLLQLADAQPASGAPQPTTTTQLGGAPGFAPQATPSTASTAPAETADKIADKPAAPVAPGAQHGAVTATPHSSVAPAVNAPSALPATAASPRSGGSSPDGPSPGSAAAPPSTDDHAEATGAPASLSPQSGEAAPGAAQGKGHKYIQLAALAEKTAAPATWKELQAKFPAQLKSASYRVVPAQVKGHTFYRVQAGPMDAAAAASACKAINAARAGACLAVNG